MRKALALILLFCLAACAIAENTGEKLFPEMSRDEVHNAVESMFRACVGTTYESEKQLRMEMTDEEQSERTAALAEYRKDTLPWLMYAFGWAPEDTEDGAEIEPWSPETAWERFAETQTGRDFRSIIQEAGIEDAATGMEWIRGVCRLWLAEIDPEKLISINDKYACWIYSADTPIDYPIVHGPDNQKWLHSLFDGSWNSAGTLFIDYRNLGAFQDPNTIIYGHHMRNDSMFGTLTEYEDQAYYDAHPWLLLIEADRISVVQLLAGYTTSKYDHCYDIAISDEDDLNAFVEEAMEKSDFVSDVTVEAGEALATLSTCAYVFDNARYIVIGKLTPVCETDCAEAAAPAE